MLLVLLNSFTIYKIKKFNWISDVYTSIMVKSFPYSICLLILYTNRQNIVHKQEKADRYPYSVRYYSPWQFMTSFLFKYGKKYWSNQTSIKIFLLASVARFQTMWSHTGKQGERNTERETGLCVGYWKLKCAREILIGAVVSSTPQPKANIFP